MKLVILITSNVENGLEVARRWQAAGAPGVTLIKSVGLYSLQQIIDEQHIELPMHSGRSMNSLMAHVLRGMEHTNHVILSVMSKAQVPTMLEEARAVMGDMTLPRHGVAFVVPLDEAIGVRNPDADS
ncbi:MAG: hypothetical protein OXG60_19620 [Chloroflexi bacterium]|nr:hypothetical protein [Chloroflexota bacterium]